jgi:hypothetical protein
MMKINDKELNPQELIALKALRSCGSNIARYAFSYVNHEDRTRKICAGEDESAHAWIGDDGCICINRKILKGTISSIGFYSPSINKDNAYQLIFLVLERYVIDDEGLGDVLARYKRFHEIISKYVSRIRNKEDSIAFANGTDIFSIVKEFERAVSKIFDKDILNHGESHSEVLELSYKASNGEHFIRNTSRALGVLPELNMNDITDISYSRRYAKWHAFEALIPSSSLYITIADYQYAKDFPVFNDKQLLLFNKGCPLKLSQFRQQERLIVNGFYLYEDYYKHLGLPISWEIVKTNNLGFKKLKLVVNPRFTEIVSLPMLFTFLTKQKRGALNLILAELVSAVMYTGAKTLPIFYLSANK